MTNSATSISLPVIQTPTRRSRWATTLLGSLLLAQGIGKLLALSGYVAALSRFEAVPRTLLRSVAIAWTATELASGAALLVAGLARIPRRGLGLAGAVLGLVACVAYSVINFRAYAIGLQLGNCTCFGKYFAQRLSPLVLVQDVYMVVFSAWCARRIRRWS